MLHASSLRVTNIVGTDGGYKTIIAIDGLNGRLTFLDNEVRNLNDCYPIPLTTKIIEKCKLFEDLSFPGNIFFALSLEKTTNTFVLTAAYNEYVSGPKVFYLHQFQNLYFALTGDELTVNVEQTP